MKNILLGVIGGIVVFKLVSIVLFFKKKGYNVKVVMIKNVINIIGFLILEIFLRNRIYVDMWDINLYYEVEYILLVDWVDMVLIVFVIYNIIGKVVNGIVDDMFIIIFFVILVRKLVFFVFVMNVNMYENLIFKENVDKLKFYGYRFIEVEEGLFVCNYVVKGRMSEFKDIVEEIERYNIYLKIENCDIILKGKKFFIISGRIKENIDFIRYLLNNLSGKMGYCFV